MKNQYGFRKVNIFILGLMALAVFSAQARPNDSTVASLRIDRYKNVIIQKLTEKLRVDLADNKVEVKLSTVQNGAVTKNRMDFGGEALAVVIDDKTELPFQFTAKVNVSNQNVEDISYKFVEAAPDFAPSLAEDSLMKELMSAISKDYKTTNIVISIDGFDTAQVNSNETKYEGTGDVRIGDLEWHKISFNVVLDAPGGTATKITYELQK